MSVAEICTRDVIIMRRDETVLEASRLIREHNVGSVVVVDEKNGTRVPVGIVTDRDLVVEIIAMEADPMAITVGDVVVSELVTVQGKCGVFETMQYMRSKGVRRLPVVDDRGGLLGIVTLDDLLSLLAEELGALARLVEHERKNVS